MAATINKQEIIAKYGRTPNDTGSPEVQIALLTARISLLTDHLKMHKKYRLQFLQQEFRN